MGTFEPNLQCGAKIPLASSAYYIMHTIIETSWTLHKVALVPQVTVLGILVAAAFAEVRNLLKSFVIVAYPMYDETTRVPVVGFCPLPRHGASPPPLDGVIGWYGIIGEPLKSNSSHTQDYRGAQFLGSEDGEGQAFSGLVAAHVYVVERCGKLSDTSSRNKVTQEVESKFKKSICGSRG